MGERSVSNYELNQNYPNPFNPSTRIRYSIKENSYVSLKVYKSLVVLVTELVNEYKPTGSYEIEFDGSILPSGVYLYKLDAGSFSATRKLVLMK